MDIRQATIKDLESIQKLNLKLFEFEKQFGDSYSLEWSFSETGTNYFKRVISKSNGICFVVEEKGEIVGYLAAVSYNNSARVGKLVAELDNMYVDENFRGKKVGSQLVKEFEKWAKDISAQILRVGAIAQNTNAIEFYKSQGFFAHEIVLEKHLD